MKYVKSEAKTYAKQYVRGAWGATYTPFTADYQIDEAAFRHNMRHCIDNLQIEGIFINGLYGEAFHQTISERMRILKIAIEEAKDDMFIMPFTSDPVLANAVEMTKYAEDAGADFAVIISPKFYFGAMTDEGIFQYYKYIADRVNIGIFIFNSLEQGYLMSPKLISRIAEIPNIVGLKNTAHVRDVTVARALCGDRIIISDANEENWLMYLLGKGQEAFVSSPAPYALQTKRLRLIKEYTSLAIKGDIAGSWEAYRRLEPIRRKLLTVMPDGKWQAAIKYWTQFLGMAGGDGRVRLPQIELTDKEKEAIEAAVMSTELH